MKFSLRFEGYKDSYTIQDPTDDDVQKVIVDLKRDAIDLNGLTSFAILECDEPINNVVLVQVDAFEEIKDGLFCGWIEYQFQDEKTNLLYNVGNYIDETKIEKILNDFLSKNISNTIELDTIKWKFWLDQFRGASFDQVKLAADNYNIAAKYVYAENCLSLRKGGQFEIERALKWCNSLAEMGMIEAQCLLGRIYYYGDVVEKNLYTAYKWFLKAATNGNNVAQYYVGLCYYYGKGIELGKKHCDYSEAIKWFTLAAENNHKIAQYLLGEMYYEGIGTEKDYCRAVKWYKYAVDNGYTKALVPLGDCFYYGHGVAQDYNTAIEYYKLSIKFHCVPTAANAALGRCYDEGKGVAQDYSIALKYFYEAARHGNGFAQFMVAKYYENGLSVEKNLLTSIFWYEKAVDHGYKMAKSDVARLKCIIQEENSGLYELYLKQKERKKRLRK